MIFYSSNYFSFGGNPREAFEHIRVNLLGNARIQFIQEMMRFYIEQKGKDFDVISRLTPKQKILYGLDDFKSDL